jgi:hypothetical protein
MKHSLWVALTALACSSAFAQAPAGTVPRPSQESSPTRSGGMPAEKVEMNTDAKKGTPAAGSAMGAGPGSTAAGMGMMKGIDADGDGMISKKEWDAHHSMMWNKMNKKGMVSVVDMEAMMKGGPN